MTLSRWFATFVGLASAITACTVERSGGEAPGAAGGASDPSADAGGAPLPSPDEIPTSCERWELTANGVPSTLPTRDARLSFGATRSLVLPETVDVPSCSDCGPDARVLLSLEVVDDRTVACAYAARDGAPFSLVGCEGEPWVAGEVLDVRGATLAWTGATNGEARASLRAPECEVDGCRTKVWYSDGDDDGFGVLGRRQSACAKPHGFAGVLGDCDDTSFVFRPAGEEPCNGRDYDCDGAVRSCEAAPAPATMAFQSEGNVITSFQPGHGFVATSGGGSPHDVNDVTDTVFGVQSAWVGTDGKRTAKTLRRVNGPAVDFTGVMPRLWLKVEGTGHLRDLSLYLGQGSFSSYYRFNLRSSQGQPWITEGDWVAFSVSFSEEYVTTVGTPNRAAITDIQLRVVDDGTGVPVKVHASRIAAVPEHNPAFPNGVVSLTFDDGWDTDAVIAEPTLSAHGFRATTYPIVGFLGSPSYLTVDQLRSLQDKAGWEVGFHCFDPALHTLGYQMFPPEVVERDMIDGKQWLFQNGFRAFDHFAYPRGEFRRPGHTDVLAIARRHFASARTVNLRHREALPPSDPHKLRVLYVTAPTPVDTVLKAIDRAVVHGEWAIVVFHRLVEVPMTNDQYRIDDFRRIVEGVATKLVPVMPVAEVFARLNAEPANP